MGNGLFSPELLQQFEDLMGVSLITALLSEIPTLLINIAIYVFTALSLYTVAKRRGIHKPWLAWIPIANAWLLGCIADQYRAVAMGETKSRRKVLLITGIARAVISVFALVLMIVMIVNLLEVGVDVVDPMYSMSDELALKLLGAVGGPAVGFGLMGLTLIPVAIVYVVFYFIALYDVYKSCDPGNATIFLVISIFLNYTQPLFLFLGRNKDDGMPAREVPPPMYTTYRQVYDEAQEPWERTEE